MLVADDEEFGRINLINCLSFCKFDHVAVANGKEAVLALRDKNNRFDLILLDLQMPEMDGFEVLQTIKDDEVINKVPVIVMSGNDEASVIARCLKFGAIDYFVKPVRIQECKALQLKMQ